MKNLPKKGNIIRLNHPNGNSTIVEVILISKVEGIEDDIVRWKPLGNYDDVSGGSRMKTYLRDALCYDGTEEDDMCRDEDCESCGGTSSYKKEIWGVDKAEFIAETREEYENTSYKLFERIPDGNGRIPYTETEIAVSRDKEALEKYCEEKFGEKVGENNGMWETFYAIEKVKLKVI